MKGNTEQILIDFGKGDAKAFQQIFDEFYEPLCYFTSKLTGSIDEGKDIVSETFVKLYQLHDKFEQLTNIKAFLYITSRNACLNLLKKKKREFVREKDFIYLQTEESFQNEFIESGVIKAMHAAIQNLPKKCRKIVEMSYFEGLKSVDIAAVLGLDESTVRNQKRIGLQKLYDELSKHHIAIAAILISSETFFLFPITH